MAKKPTRGAKVERIVREELSGMLNVRFMSSHADLVIARRSTGEKVLQRFALVSDDKQVVGVIKTDRYTPNWHESTRLPRALAACRWLELVPAKRRLLVLTNRQMHDKLKHDLDGIVDRSIEILYVDP